MPPSSRTPTRPACTAFRVRTRSNTGVRRRTDVSWAVAKLSGLRRDRSGKPSLFSTTPDEDLNSSARFQAALVYLRVFQEHVESGRHSSVQSASAFAEAAADNVEVEKSPRWIRDHLERSERVRFLLHRGARAETVNRRHMIRGVAITAMQNRFVEPLDPSLDDDLVMRIAAADMPAIATEQTHRSVRVNGVRVVVPEVVQDAPNSV